MLELQAWARTVPWKLVLAVLFGLGNATSMFLAVRGVPWAWLVVIVSQSLNITYLVVTGQYWVLIGGQPICLVIGIYGLQRWLRKGVHRDPRHAKSGPVPDPQLLVGYDPAVTGGALLVLRRIRTPEEHGLREVLEELYGPALELHAGHLRAIDAVCRGTVAASAPATSLVAGNGGRHRAAVTQESPTQVMVPAVAQDAETERLPTRGQRVVDHGKR